MQRAGALRHLPLAGDAPHYPVHLAAAPRPLTCTPQTPLGEALQQMQQAQMGSITITNAAGEFPGILSLHDRLARLVLPQRPLTTRIAEVMTPQPLAPPATARVWEAALMMAREGFGYRGVLQGRRLIRITSERDLFALQRVGPATLSRDISRAETIATLRQLQQEIRRMAEQMLAQGASVDQITQIVATLNDALTRQVIALTLAECEVAPPPSSGSPSAARGARSSRSRPVRTTASCFCRRRASRSVPATSWPALPTAARALAEWQGGFARWLEQGTPQHLLQATIVVAFCALHGEPVPVEELRRWLLEKARSNSRFRRQMAEHALGNRPPLGLLGEIHVRSGGAHPHTIDLEQRRRHPLGKTPRGRCTTICPTPSPRLTAAVAPASFLPSTSRPPAMRAVTPSSASA